MSHYVSDCSFRTTNLRPACVCCHSFTASRSSSTCSPSSSKHRPVLLVLFLNHLESCCCCRASQNRSTEVYLVYIEYSFLLSPPPEYTCHPLTIRAADAAEAYGEVKFYTSTYTCTCTCICSSVSQVLWGLLFSLFILLVKVLSLLLSLVLYMDVMPLGGKFITTFAIAIGASVIIKFLVVPLQRRRIQSMRVSSLIQIELSIII